MTGVLVAGEKMHTYITRHGLGSGPNLSCTALYLTLLSLVQAVEDWPGAVEGQRALC